MADTERDIDLERGLRALSGRQRQAVLLHYLADLDLAQVARAMRCSPGTVRKHLARGLEALRQQGITEPMGEQSDRLGGTR